MGHQPLFLVYATIGLSAMFPTAANSQVPAENAAKPRVALFDYLASDGATMVAYTPSELDPRNPANHLKLPTRSIRADLEALRPAFDGLILYGYHEASTPRILAVAKDLEFRAVMLGIWQPKSAAEVDGVAALVRQFGGDFALAVLVGNEGLTFKRYEADDILHAAARLRSQLPATVPLSTSEPLVGYQLSQVREFGDFLAPNIHPVFDRPDFAAAEAAKWVRQEAARLARQTSKPVVVKETGFPHAGRDKFTPQTQQQFWADYLQPGVLSRLDESSDDFVFHGVAFEAFDLPWKAAASSLEIEKSWGLLSSQRTVFPAFTVWREISQTRNRTKPQP